MMVSEIGPIEEIRGMPCPSCSYGSRVTHTWNLDDGKIKRRRKCRVCRLVWLTVEARVVLAVQISKCLI